MKTLDEKELLPNTLKAIDNLLGDIQEEIQMLPGTKNLQVLNTWRQMQASIGKANQQVAELRKLSKKW